MDIKYSCYVPFKDAWKAELEPGLGPGLEELGQQMDILLAGTFQVGVIWSRLSSCFPPESAAAISARNFFWSGLPSTLGV
jgi:hypothetical protein